MQADLKQLCKVCDAPLGEHIIGGPGPYHPLPIKPGVCWACGDKKEEWWNYCAMCGKHLAAGR